MLAYTVSSTSDLPYSCVGAAWQEAHSQMWVDIWTSVPQYKGGHEEAKNYYSTHNFTTGASFGT